MHDDKFSCQVGQHEAFGCMQEGEEEGKASCKARGPIVDVNACC